MNISNRFCALLATAVAAFALATGAAPAQDPVAVAPDCFRVLLENSAVRVLEMTVQPGRKVPMHVHPSTVTYHIGPSTEKHIFGNGSMLVHDYLGGEVGFSRPFYHAVENTGTTVDHVLTIEIKNEPIGVEPATLAELDPKKYAPENYVVRLDNLRVRVLEITVKPGGMIPLHMHPSTVIYHIGPAKERHTFGEGETEDQEYQGGDVTYFGPYARSAKNIGDREMHVLSVELKK